jgi:hypothetical protein
MLSPSKQSSKEKGKTLQTIMYHNSPSLQTYDYVLGTTTFYLSLSDGFSMSIKHRGMQEGAQALDLGPPKENSSSNGHKSRKSPYNPTLKPLCHDVYGLGESLPTPNILLETKARPIPSPVEDQVRKASMQFLIFLQRLTPYGT